jgi:tRNA pseudouridine55 synthase
MPKPGKAAIDGILNIDKPYGVTSMDVVRRIKRAARQRRVGHGGTLDPIATGVIPVCLGQATRLMEDVVGGSKSYMASVELGLSTDTYDALGEVTERRDASSITLAEVEGALPAFVGDVLQVPPMYSALKQGGKRLYDLARAGVKVEREARPVTVHDIAIEGWEPPMVRLRVDCGKGFYVRSLAHDLGRALGCGGHMKALVRLRSGAFSVDDALPLGEAEERFEDGSWREVVYSPDVALRALRAIIVGGRVEEMVRNGRFFDAEGAASQVQPGERCRAYTADGRFLAIVAYDADLRRWKPDKVFALGYAG